MSNYTKSTNFAVKDGLSAGTPAKRVRGTEIDDEYNAISVAVATKANTNNAALTGIPTAPTAATTTNTTQLATTAFVKTAVDNASPPSVQTFTSSGTFTKTSGMVGAKVTIIGGGGGTGPASSGNNPVSPSASGGDINIQGAAWGYGHTNDFLGGDGGNSSFGGGGRGGKNETGRAGSPNTGAGGGGGGSASQTVQGGGTGAAGICIVEEFF